LRQPLLVGIQYLAQEYFGAYADYLSLHSGIIAQMACLMASIRIS
jgi:hypothetical protein